MAASYNGWAERGGTVTLGPSIGERRIPAYHGLKVYIEGQAAVMAYVAPSCLHLFAMLRTVAHPSLRAAAIARGSLTSHLVTHAALGRSLSSGRPSGRPALESKPTDVSAMKGSEGLHRSEYPYALPVL